MTDQQRAQTIGASKDVASRSSAYFNQLTRFQDSWRRQDLSSCLSTSESLLTALAESLNTAFSSSQVDEAKQKLRIREKISHNLVISRACMKFQKNLLHVSTREARKELETLLQAIESSVQVVLAAKTDVEKPQKQKLPISSSHENNVILSLVEKALAADKDAVDSHLDSGLFVFLYNYAAVCIHLNESYVALRILEALFQAFQVNYSEGLKEEKRTLNEGKRGRKNIGLPDESLLLTVCLSLLHLYTVVQNDFTVDENSYHESSSSSPMATSSTSSSTKGSAVTLVFNINAGKLIEKAHQVIEFLETAVYRAPEADSQSSTHGLKRDYAEFKFRLQLYKSSIRVLENNIKQSRKEVKSALEIFQHELKKAVSEIGLNLGFGLSSQTEAAKNQDIANSTFNTTALCLKANLEYLKNNHRKSIKLLQSSLRLCLDRYVFFNNMACIHHSLKQTQTALLYLSRASEACHAEQQNVATRGVMTSLWFNLGLQFLSAEQPQAAFKCLKKASVTMLNQPKVWLCLSQCVSMAVGAMISETQQTLVSTLDTVVQELKDRDLGKVSPTALDTLLTKVYAHKLLCNEKKKEIVKQTFMKTGSDGITIIAGLEAVTNCLFLLNTFTTGLDLSLQHTGAGIFDLGTAILSDVVEQERWFGLESDREQIHRFASLLPNDYLLIGQNAFLIRAFLLLAVEDYIAAIHAALCAIILLRSEESIINANITSLHRDIDEASLSPSAAQSKSDAKVSELDPYYLKRKQEIVSSLITGYSYCCEAGLKTGKGLEYGLKCLDVREDYRKFQMKYWKLYKNSNNLNGFQDKVNNQSQMGMIRINLALASLSRSKFDKIDSKARDYMFREANKHVSKSLDLKTDRTQAKGVALLIALKEKNMKGLAGLTKQGTRKD